MKEWNIRYEGNEIRVENRWFGEKLFINNQLQDIGRGLSSRAKLIGKLADGRMVKVSIGGSLGIHCTIFVEDEMILDD